MECANVPNSEWNRITRIRREIAAGTYFTPERVQTAVDHLVAHLLGGTLAGDIPTNPNPGLPRLLRRGTAAQKRPARRWRRSA